MLKKENGVLPCLCVGSSWEVQRCLDARQYRSFQETARLPLAHLPIHGSLYLSAQSDSMDCMTNLKVGISPSVAFTPLAGQTGTEKH